MTREPKSKEGKRRKAAEVALFVQRYGRKARVGGLDPNDRNYDRQVESAVKRMRPEQLDALLRQGEDD